MRFRLRGALAELLITTNLSTSNVSIGASSSASGGFALSAFPATVDLDTRYEVAQSITLTGCYLHRSDDHTYAEW